MSDGDDVSEEDCDENNGVYSEEDTQQDVFVTVYHVTDIPSSDVGKRYNTIRWSVADDKDLDKDMAGLPVACFTTNTIKDGKGKVRLPNASVYPRSATKDTEWKRVSFMVNLSDWNLFSVAKWNNQRHVVALKRNDHGDDLLRNCFSQLFFYELKYPHYVVSVEGTAESFFPENKAKVYKLKNYDRNNFIVNVNFAHDMFLNQGVNWDIVRKIGEPLEVNNQVKKMLSPPEISANRLIEMHWFRNEWIQSKSQKLKLATCEASVRFLDYLKKLFLEPDIIGSLQLLALEQNQATTEAIKEAYKVLSIKR